MKIGIAVPIMNPSFKAWDDVGTWSDPSKWDLNGTYLTADRRREAFMPNGRFEGWDDDAALQLAVTQAPDDWTHIVHSNDDSGLRFWPSEQFDLSTAQKYYWSFAGLFVVGTGGANKSIGFFFYVGDDENLSSVNSVQFTDYDGSSSPLFFDKYSGTMEGGTAITTTNGYDFSRVSIGFRDMTSLHYCCVDNIGIMFDPFNGNGYYELTNVFATNGPAWRYQSFVKRKRTNRGTLRKYDPSGGAEPIRLSMELRNEEAETYEQMLRFYRMNRGVDGIPGVPLLIEPNIPGLPLTMMVDCVDQHFPMVRTNQRAKRYAGTFNFETIWT